MTTALRWAAALVAVSLTAACTDPATTSAYSDVPSEGWLYGAPLTFTVDSLPLPPTAAMTVALTHNNDYPFRNIWLEARYLTADSVEVADTVNIELCDRFGRWFGKGFGANYQISAPIPHRAVPAPGSCVEIRQILRVDTLRGIEKVGLDMHPL